MTSNWLNLEQNIWTFLHFNGSLRASWHLNSLWCFFCYNWSNPLQTCKYLRYFFGNFALKFLNFLQNYVLITFSQSLISPYNIYEELKVGPLGFCVLRSFFSNSEPHMLRANLWSLLFVYQHFLNTNPGVESIRRTNLHVDVRICLGSVGLCVEFPSFLSLTFLSYLFLTVFFFHLILIIIFKKLIPIYFYFLNF